MVTKYKKYILVCVAGLAAIALALIATHNSQKPSNQTKSISSESTNTSTKKVDGCAQVTNAKFESVNDHLDLGLGVNGPVYGKWTVDFTQNQYTYKHSDIEEAGSYTCSNNSVMLQAKNGSKLRAVYYPAQKSLILTGKSYKKTN